MSLPASLLVATMLVAGLVNLPASILVGPITGQGALTFVLAGASWLLLVYHGTVTRTAVAVVAPFGWYVAWSFGSLVWNGVSKTALQNLLVVLGFVGFLLLGARESYRSPGLALRLGRALGVATVVAAALCAIGLAKAGPGANLLIGPRPFAIFALLGLAWLLAGWRYGRPLAIVGAAGIVTLIALSLSRLALVVGLALFPLATIRSGRRAQWVRIAFCSAAAAGALLYLVSAFEPLRARFFEGDTSLTVGDMRINATGRTAFWSIILDSFRESPWIGKGAGSAQAVIADATQGIGHPHSDYLRILHDSGLIGFVLWLLGFLRLIRTTWQAWVAADHRGDFGARVHLAAFLATIAVAAAMVTDNALVYVFVMAPFAILTGASLGTAVPSEVRYRARRAYLADGDAAVAWRAPQ